MRNLIATAIPARATLRMIRSCVVRRETRSLHRVGRIGADDSDLMVEKGCVHAGYIDLGHVARYAILGRYRAPLAWVIALCGMSSHCVRCGAGSMAGEALLDEDRRDVAAEAGRGRGGGVGAVYAPEENDEHRRQAASRMQV